MAGFDGMDTDSVPDRQQLDLENLENNLFRVFRDASVAATGYTCSDRPQVAPSIRPSRVAGARRRPNHSIWRKITFRCEEVVRTVVRS